MDSAAALEGFYERAGLIDREVCAQRRLIRSLLEEEQPHRILTVDCTSCEMQPGSVRERSTCSRHEASTSLKASSRAKMPVARIISLPPSSIVRT
jgi:hypothetical protein